MGAKVHSENIPSTSRQFALCYDAGFWPHMALLDIGGNMRKETCWPELVEARHSREGHEMYLQ